MNWQKYMLLLLKGEHQEKIMHALSPSYPLVSSVINTWFGYIFLNYKSYTVNSLHGSFYEGEL